MLLLTGMSVGRRRLTLMLFGLLMPCLLQATHIMGGDIVYECLGGDQYRVRLTLYRDCEGINAPVNAAYLRVISATCGESRSEAAPKVGFQELTPVCPSQQSNSTCSGGSLPGVEEHIYETVLTLGACPDWRIFFRGCCRNFAITNLVNAGNESTFIETQLNSVVAPCNNSPVFSNKPVPYICANQPYQYSNGAIDPDGDSLAYEIVPPKSGDNQGNTQLIPFVNPFNLSYPLATSPVNDFNFDPNSGQMAFTPDGLQQPVLSVRVKEYRNGILIGSIVRDIQMIVLNCNNQVPILSPATNVAGGVLTNQTFSVCAGATLSFDITGTDPDVGQNLTLTSNIASAIPGATLSSAGTNPVTGNFSWATTLADTGSYFLTFTLGDDGCPLTAQQVIGYNIVVAQGNAYPPQFVTVCPSATGTIQLQSQIPNTGGSYQWSPATGLSSTTIPNPTANIPAGGTFDYNIVYDNGGACPEIEQIRIRPEAEISLVADSLVICPGESAQLEAQLLLTGPPIPFTYSWDPPTTLNDPTLANPIASPTTSQLYTVTATTLSCTYEATAWVEVRQIPELDPIPDAQICSGASTLLTSSGNFLNGATYSWSPVGGLSNSQAPTTQASPGTTTTYTLTATNQCGSDQVNTTVEVFAPMNITLSATHVSCNGAGDGVLTANITGGSGNTSFTWLPGGMTSPTLNNLGPGVYTLQANDDAGCQAIASTSITEPAPLAASIANQNNISCFGETDGSLDINASGGTPGYTYSIDGGPFQTQSQFINLTGGIHTVSVRDQNQCEVILGPITILQPSAPLALNVTNTVPAGCNSTLGQIGVLGAGGTPPYMYRLNGGPYQGSGNFTGLGPGNYLMETIDANGCENSITVGIFLINDPVLVQDSLQPVSCYGGSDGVLGVSPAGGQGPYLLSLNGQPFASDTLFSGLPAGLHQIILRDASAPPCEVSFAFDMPEPDSLAIYPVDARDISCANGLDGSTRWTGSGGVRPYTYSQNGGTAIADSFYLGLGAGTYTTLIIDANGCISQPESLLLTEPSPLVMTGLTDSVRCFGERNGALSVQASGGTPPYRYRLDGGPLVIDSSFSGLAAGTYPVVVEDAQGCLEQIFLTIEEPDPISLTWAEVRDPSCYRRLDGLLSVVANGGNSFYQFSLDTLPLQTAPVFSDLGAGSYRIIVADLKGCAAALDTTLIEPTELIVEITPTPVSCFGADDGGAMATASGGTGPYQYSWTDDGSTDQVRENLGPLTLQVIATDVNGCIATDLNEVNSPPQVLLDSSLVQDVRCYGDSSGSVFVRGMGGVGSFSYSWEDGSNDTLRTNLPAGTYEVLVQDSLGCGYRDTFDIQQPDSLQLELVEYQASYCERPNGLLRVQPGGGTPPYAIAWETIPITEDSVAMNLYAPPGDTSYHVVLADSLGCSIRRGFVLEGEAAPMAIFDHGEPGDTIYYRTGEVQFINQSLDASTYLWDFGDGRASSETDPLHPYQEEGSYLVQLVAFDSRFECPDTAYLPVTLLPLGRIYVPNAFSPNGDGINEGFRAIGMQIEQLRMRIFNRWGHLIYELNSPENSWKGITRNGTPVPEGVYVYRLEARLGGGATVERAGTVTLIR